MNGSGLLVCSYLDALFYAGVRLSFQQIGGPMTTTHGGTDGTPEHTHPTGTDAHGHPLAEGTNHPPTVEAEDRVPDAGEGGLAEGDSTPGPKHEGHALDAGEAHS